MSDFDIQELEDVYEELGAVLDEMEEGQLGPRTAAIARLAHGLFKVIRAHNRPPAQSPASVMLCILLFFSKERNKSHHQANPGQS